MLGQGLFKMKQITDSEIEKKLRERLSAEKMRTLTEEYQGKKIILDSDIITIQNRDNNRGYSGIREIRLKAEKPTPGENNYFVSRWRFRVLPDGDFSQNPFRETCGIDSYIEIDEGDER